MIAEFKMDGQDAAFSFQFDDYCGHVCDYCGVKDGLVPVIQPGHYEPQNGRGLVPGWVRAAGETFSAPSGASSNPELYQRVGSFVCRSLQPRNVHRREDCLKAWMKDQEAHPGIQIREPRSR